MSVHNTLANGGSASAAERAVGARTILWGTLIAGSADIVAGVLPWVLKGVPLQRVLQSIASGLLGREAFSGGAWTATLGLLLHLPIAYLTRRFAGGDVRAKLSSKQGS